MLSPVHRLLLLGLALVGAGLGQTVAAESLAGASPFLPPASQGQAAATPDSTLELRGIVAAGDDTRFSIYDATKRMSAWKRLNEPGNEFVVRSYDSARDAVTVDYQGRTLTLTLKTAKVASAPVQALPPPVVNAPGPGSPQPIGGPVVLNPTPADEQRRLEAIAAEVNRRRMIRQQALQASRATAGQPPRPQQPGLPNPQGR